jgi:2-keto-4-pentenoate hydratase
MKLYKGNELVGEGTGAAVLGDPCLAVAWLANRLWGYGVTLKAGEVILSGAFSAAPPARKGDIFTAEFSSFGKVSAEFV